MTSSDSRHPVLTIALLVTAVLPSWTCAEREPSDLDVVELIKQLGDDDRQIRRHAEKTLLRAGIEVLARMPKDKDIADFAARDAVRRIRNQLERQRAHDALTSSRITLQGNFTLQHVLSEFNEQTGNRLDPKALNDLTLNRTVRINFKDMPFWQALDLLLEVADLNYDEHVAVDSIALRSVHADEPKTSGNVEYVDAFRITAQIGRVRGCEDGNNDQILPVHVEIRVEPRLHALSLGYTDADFTMTGADGASLRSFTPDARSALPLGDGRRTVRFLAPRFSSSEPYALHGRFDVLVAADTQPFVFSDPAVGITQRRGQVTALIKEIRFEDRDTRTKDARVHVAVTYDTGGPAFASHRTWILQNPAYLQCDEEPAIEYSARETTLQADGVIAARYVFRNLSRPISEYQFVYETPTLITTVPLSVQFENLTIKNRSLQ